MPLSPATTKAVEAVIGSNVNRASAVGGGCIARAWRVETGETTYFVKSGPDKFGDLFDAEAHGLRLLESVAGTLRIPRVVARSPAGAESAILVLEWLDVRAKGARFSEVLGRGLAGLHRTDSARFGLERDNFIGSTPQHNTLCDNWVDFFLEMRLEPQARLARDNERWRSSWDGLFENLMRELDQLLPPRPEASLVHGDLWAGNVLPLSSGQAGLIDPAVYYGHREVDIAMTELFGRFGSSFYAAYEEAWPLAAGYDERKVVYNLYHLLNHLNLFGGSYASSVEEVLNRFR